MLFGLILLKWWVTGVADKTTHFLGYLNTFVFTMFYNDARYYLIIYPSQFSQLLPNCLRLTNTVCLQKCLAALSKIHRVSPYS